MTKIPELSGDIDIMRTKMNKQAEIIKAQRAALREARRIMWLLDRVEELHRYHVNYHDVGPIAEKARAWLAENPEEKDNE